MTGSPHEATASDFTLPISEQHGDVQQSPTSTSSGTLTPFVKESSSCSSSLRFSACRKILRTALRSLVDRQCGHGGSTGDRRDIEKAQGPDEENEPTESEDEEPQIITRSLDYIKSGYPNLATFLDSDENFMVYRRFGYLQSRMLLEKQDDLRQLEERLDKLDFAQQYSEPDALFSRRDFGEERRDLLTSIEKAFCEYSQLLISAQQLQSFNRPTRAEHQSVLNYMKNPGPVYSEEAKFTLCKEDLITLRAGREHAWLDRAIERVLRKLHWGPFTRPLEYLFCPKELQDKKSNGLPIYYGKERIEGCSSVVVVLMIVFMLILPIYLLYHLVKHSAGAMSAHENAMYMGILLVFTLVFAAIMSFFTKARRHEILGAAAAYCAVLVVFLGNLDGPD